MTCAHYVFPSHPGLDCKHCKNRNRHQANPLIVDCCPSQDCQRDVSHQRDCQLFLHKRLYERSLAHARHLASGFPLHSPPLNGPIWCTGEDSNLRTSQGGADLQSAGFNHSPTCAEMLLSRSPLFRQPSPGLQLALGGVCACSKSPLERRSAQLLVRSKSPQLEKLPYGVPLESCQCHRAAQTSCVRKPILELAKGLEPLTL